MIKAYELRIWNYIRYGDHIVRVQDLQGRHNYVQTIQGLDGYANEYVGIALTPEILEKAGFKKEKTVIGEYWLKDQYYVKYGNHCGYVFGINKGMGNLITLSSAMCVHQLQNIYFTLTGEELEINL